MIHACRHTHMFTPTHTPPPPPHKGITQNYVTFVYTFRCVRNKTNKFCSKQVSGQGSTNIKLTAVDLTLTPDPALSDIFDVV